jgi:carbon-monoxide dehydrogenase large subunit
MSDTGIGASVRRKEDQRFITGAGRYVDDISVRGQTYAVFIRSPHAHATIKSINTGKAKSAPGVVAVLTGDDVAADKIGGMPVGWGITQPDGTAGCASSATWSSASSPTASPRRATRPSR